MDKKERQQLEKDFMEQLREDLKNMPSDKRMAILYILAFLSVISAIAAVIWLG
ncbi:MAG: hypothetical protein ACI4PP_01455 [Clostridia bacterium]